MLGGLTGPRRSGDQNQNPGGFNAAAMPGLAGEFEEQWCLRKAGGDELGDVTGDADTTGDALHDAQDGCSDVEMTRAEDWGAHQAQARAGRGVSGRQE
jgi:hypothetical protein